MSSSGGGIGTTITGGIQDIAAILPLFGAEQCSVQVSSALTRGYLYAAATPMSIFGSLGVVIAGFKTLIACISFGNIEGARILGNMGFEPQGENLSLIMVKPGKGKNARRYIIETRIDELITELNIDKKRITGVSHKSAVWNVKMMTTTALLCTFSIAPYIYLNQSANSLDKSATWLFPVVRATGGFITTTLIQILIQRRITTLSNQYLDKRDQPLPHADVESGIKKYQVDARLWLLLCFLLIGLVASVGWFCLESGLFFMRLAIWACNPSDDAPPLEIMIELDKVEHKPLPTCNKDNEEILRSKVKSLPTCNKDIYEILLYKVLPLTRARDFLKIITSFAGLIEPFHHPDLTLYYTLTRKRPFEKTDGPREIEAKKYKLGNWTLYITVFDHKERTTRVFTRDNEMDIFYSTKSDAPLVDVGHFVLEVEIDAKIDPKGDPVSSDSSILDSLREHHRSILENILYRLGAGDITKPYAIENSWTMKVENSISTFQRLREENAKDWKTVVEKGKVRERDEESRLVCDYFTHPSIEKERRSLDEKRGKWIARRMEMRTKETKERFLGMGVEYRVDKQPVEKNATRSRGYIGYIEGLLFREQFVMELLLLYEVKEWERFFWNKLKSFLDHIGNDRVEAKERLSREWRADCWRRLSHQMRAAEKRLADNCYLGHFSTQWASSVSQFFDGVEKPNLTLSDLRIEIEFSEDEFRLRIEKEIEDTEFRLNRGYEMGRFDQFWDDHALFECRYSRSKWLYLPLIDFSSGAPLKIYSHALKGNENIIHITFSHLNSDSDIDTTICDLHGVTSMSRGSSGHPPTIHRDPLYIKSTNNDLIKFAKEVGPKLDLTSTYIFTDAGSFDLYSNILGTNARILISFVAPSSDQSLTLRLKHSGREDGPLVVALGSTTIQLNPSSKSSLTIDDITLYPNPGLNRLSFVPGRNDIFIQFTVERHGHLLHDIVLLDEAGLKDPRNQIITVDRT